MQIYNLDMQMDSKADIKTSLLPHVLFEDNDWIDTHQTKWVNFYALSRGKYKPKKLVSLSTLKKWLQNWKK